MTDMSGRPLMTFRRACVVCALVLLAAVAGAVGAEPAGRTGHAGRCRASRAQCRSVRRGRAPAAVAPPTRGRSRFAPAPTIARGRYAEAEKLLTPVAPRPSQAATPRSSSDCCRCSSAAAPTAVRTLQR